MPERRIVILAPSAPHPWGLGGDGGGGGGDGDGGEGLGGGGDGTGACRVRPPGLPKTFKFVIQTMFV